MTLELFREIKHSFILNTNNKISKLISRLGFYKWIVLVAFIIGLVDVSDKSFTNFSIWLNVIVWVSVFLFLLITGIFRYLKFKKIKKLSKKHTLDKKLVDVTVYEVLSL
jgi:hypothetical protein